MADEETEGYESHERVVIGTEKCGCVTFAHAEPTGMDDSYGPELLALVTRGGKVESLRADEAKKRDNFLPVHCPHSPVGWTHDTLPPPQEVEMGWMEPYDDCEEPLRALEEAIDDFERGIRSWDEVLKVRRDGP